MRINRGDSVVGAAFGHTVSLHGDGSVSRKPITHEDRIRLLVDDIGMSEEIASRLPADTPAPPLPWSQATAQGGKHGSTRSSTTEDTGNTEKMEEVGFQTATTTQAG
ncbi:MAG: hypothetical protein WAM53_13625 [Terrimicrobiaceae bacterium]